jgi:hypothetical protein
MNSVIKSLIDILIIMTIGIPFVDAIKTEATRNGLLKVATRKTLSGRMVAMLLLLSLWAYGVLSSNVLNSIYYVGRKLLQR